MRLRHYIRQFWLGAVARSSSDYWERRYRAGMTSGAGSASELAAFKAETLNAFVCAHAIQSVIELGCGDGNQLSLAKYPRYLGLDVSQTAIQICSQRFTTDSSKAFLWYQPEYSSNLANFVSAELTLSLDVIYHLLEDRTYYKHLHDLFSMARRFVIIYSSNRTENHPAAHVRHREFAADVRAGFPHFRLVGSIPNPYPDQSFADFFVYARDSR